MKGDFTHDELIMSIVARARRLTERERASYLPLACENNRHLWEEVAEALEWEEKMGGFLQQPVLASSDVRVPLEIGQVLGNRFEIIREIGEGGMGVVYEAIDRKRDQRIAIKAAKPGFQHFLSPELRNALKLRHPNICLVNEIHTARDANGEFDFLSMELLNGKTLSLHLADRGRLALPQAVEVARQLCSALKVAHDNGVIHGDLKTSNIILCQTQGSGMRAVITDFGLSGEIGQPGQLRGTPGYMAPEVWQGVPASPASDIYSLGLILHQLLSPGDQAIDMPAGRPSREFPRAYRTLVDRLISIDPNRRIQGFLSAPSTLRNMEWLLLSRRWLFAAAASGAIASLGAFWIEREIALAWIENAAHPLPAKRFILIWMAPATDLQARSLLSSAMEAAENDLVRAEAADPALYVIAPPEAQPPAIDSISLAAARDSLGANLILAASCELSVKNARISLAVLDVPTGRTLRHLQVDCDIREINTLSARAAAAAAHLLNARVQHPRPAVTSTASPVAFHAFQSGNAEMNKRNDSGLDAAIQDYAAAVDADPRFALAHAELARAYCRLYALRGSESVLELARANAARAVALNGELPEAHTALAFVYQSKGDQQGALAEIAHALVLDPSNPKTLVWQAQIYTRFRQWDKADQTYLRLQRERPNYWLAYQERGVLLNLQGRNAEALEAFRTATTLASWSGLAFSNLGMLLLKVGNIPESLSSFRKSMAINPNDDGTYLSYAQALAADGQFEAALSSALKAVALNPGEDENWLGLADCYQMIRAKQRQARDSYSRAAREVERALRTDSSDGARWMRLALYRAKLDPHASQDAILRKAERLGGEDADSRIVQARVLIACGHREEGIAMLPAWLKNGLTAVEFAFVPELRDPLTPAAK